MKKFNDSLKYLEDKGLNIFGSCHIRSLPAELQEDLLSANVPITEYTSLGVLAHGGRLLWENLQHPAKEVEHPFDNHSLLLLDNLKNSISAEEDILVLFPNNKWSIPLQRIGRFLNLARPSKLGLDLNLKFGPWFAYRAVFLTKIKLPELIEKNWVSPCDSCMEKPCIAACPSGATEKKPFGLSLCADYRLKKESMCLSRCPARIACPYQSEHRYTEAQLNYHMTRPSHLSRLAEYR